MAIRWDKPCAADESNRERETSDYRQSPKASKAKSPIAVNSKEDVNASEEDSHLRQIKVS